jgi:hypothetical protein
MISLDELEGWWKLSSAWHEFDVDQRRYPFGNSAVGSLVFSDKSRVMSVIVADGHTAHPPGYAIEAYSGRFVIEGSEIITTVDGRVSSRQEWIGSDLRHFVSLSRDVLHLTSPRQTNSLYPGVQFSAASSWVRTPQ